MVEPQVVLATGQTMPGEHLARVQIDALHFAGVELRLAKESPDWADGVLGFKSA